MINKKSKKKHKKIKYEEENENFIPKAFLKDRQEETNVNLKKSIHKNQKRLKKEANNEEKNVKNKITKKKIIIAIIIIFILFFAIWLGIITNQWKTLAKEMTNDDNSTVINTEGKEIAKLGSERKHINISIFETPDNLKNAYISIEDERFYSHGGVDIKRTLGAISSYIFHFGSSSYGGSTITQQLVKNLTGDTSDNIGRKVSEWWRASQLETCLSKEEILEAYLNVIYVGPNMYGTGTGAKYYFNKSVDDLTLAECAYLAGINNSPNSYNPFSDEDNTEKINKRTKTVLDKMLELNYIDESSYNTAIKSVEDGLDFKKGNINSNDGVYSYHTDALINNITKDIQNKYGISEPFATNYINMAGLVIYSTQDESIQKQIETESKKSKYILTSDNGVETSQAAMVIIDHKTGYVLGCTGGLGEKTKARSFNRATQSVRQTGSAIKPLSVLAPAIDKKIITASSIFDDSERDFAEGYHPTDYNGALGEITVRRAVESSQNIPFVEMMEKLKPSSSISYLKNMGISTLTKEDETLVLALGGLQKGISPLEMAGAYATIANDGKYIEPVFYKEIKNRSGDKVIEPKQETRQVFSKEVAYILKELLTQPVIGKNGTATYCKISGIDVAAKTGTTDSDYDRWLCGFTPYYTAVTWFGFDQNETVEYNNRNPAGLIWANVMSKIHVGKANVQFEKPYAISTATICVETGKRARTGCTNTYTEYFLWFTTPDLCDKHSGTEQEEKNATANSIVTNTVQEITNDIDGVERPNVTNTNNNTNKTNYENTNTNVNKKNETIINTNSNNTNNITNNTNINENKNNLNTNTNTSVNTTNTDVKNETNSIN